MTREGVLSRRNLDEYGPPCCVFRSRFLSGYVFELREASKAPDETVAILYRRNGNNYRQCGAGYLQGGVWKNRKGGKPLNPDGLYWCEMVKEDAA